MPAPSLFVNGQDVDALGLKIEPIKGPWDVPAMTDPTLVIPGRAGALRTGAPLTIATRDIAIDGKIYESSASRTHADLQSKIDTLKLLFSVGLLELRFADQPTRAFVGELTKFEVTMIGGSLIATSADVSITFSCADPYGYDVLPVCMGFAGDRVSLPPGGAPSSPVIRVMGPATNPTLTYRNLSGDSVHAIGLTRALLSTDYEEIDCGLQKITRYQSGVASNDLAALTSGDIEAFAISPEDGDDLAGQYPTIECSGLTGAGNCEIIYTRARL